MRLAIDIMNDMAVKILVQFPVERFEMHWGASTHQRVMWVDK